MVNPERQFASQIADIQKPNSFLLLWLVDALDLNSLVYMLVCSQFEGMGFVLGTSWSFER